MQHRLTKSGDGFREYAIKTKHRNYTCISRFIIYQEIHEQEENFNYVNMLIFACIWMLQDYCDCDLHRNGVSAGV